MTIKISAKLILNFDPDKTADITNIEAVGLCLVSREVIDFWMPRGPKRVN